MWIISRWHPLLINHHCFSLSTGVSRALKKIEVPLDEFGIPRRVALMKEVLSTLETEHIWTGYYDVHHTAWPRAEYRTVDIMDGDDDFTASRYRGCESLKIRSPRQLHNYIHLVSSPPPLPDAEVMRQYVREHTQISRLFDTIKHDNYQEIPQLAILPYEVQERLRSESYEKKLRTMSPGELGLMPDIEYLAGLTIIQARHVLRALVRVQGLSNSRHSKRHFFTHDLVVTHSQHRGQ